MKSQSGWVIIKKKSRRLRRDGREEVHPQPEVPRDGSAAPRVGQQSDSDGFTECKCLEHQLQTEFQSHRDLIDTFLGVWGFNQNKRPQSEIHLIRWTGQQQNKIPSPRQDGTKAKGIEKSLGRTDWDSGQLLSDEVFWSLAVRFRFARDEFIGLLGLWFIAEA